MRTRTRWVVGATTLVVLVGAGATAYAQTTDGSASSYRLATVATGTVEETLTSAGTVDKEHRADVAFGTGGTVAKVSVTLGQHVTAGQVVATLDPTDAQAGVDSAEATLAKAKAQLVSDEDAQSSTVSSSSSAGGSSSGASQPQTTKPQTTKPQTTKPQTSTPQTSGGSGSGSGSGTNTQAVTAALAQLATQQQAVTSAQSAVTQALGEAADALTQQQSACTVTTTTEVSQACQDALAAVQTKQETVKTAEQTLSDALTSLTTTLTGAVAALQHATSARTTVSLTAYRTTTSSTDDTPSSGGATTQGQTVTAATLAKDQAAIDTAKAGLIDAQRSLSATVVKAPIAGTVASLDLTKGNAVASGDTATVITSGSALVIDTTVSESKIREITVGQRVVVSTPGSSTTSDGTVQAIGVTADSGSSSVSYPVTVRVDKPSSMLASGSSVVLQIVTDSADDVLTVPSSAVTTSGSRSTVRVHAADGTVTTTPVTLGAVGATRTQVTSGLKAGQRVVLADLDQTITGASTSVDTRGGFQGGAGFPGGGTRSGGTGGPPGAP